MAQARYCPHEDNNEREKSAEMTLNCENVLSRGIVGVPAKILESPDSTLQGIVGTVVFETKNTIFIREDFTVRQVAKRAAKKLQLQRPSCACFISGSALIGRPEDRISRLKNGSYDKLWLETLVFQLLPLGRFVKMSSVHSTVHCL